jgi:hypothetical protein
MALFTTHRPSKRQKTQVVGNIPTLKRKEKSTYKPSDIWTKQEHAIFLQYCGNKRDRCYHAMAIDTGCRGNIFVIYLQLLIKWDRIHEKYSKTQILSITFY